MKSMKKIEVIIEAIYVNKLLEIFANHNISGYTIIRDIEGLGAHGLKTADDACDLFSNNYIFTVCEEEIFLFMKEDIRAFVQKYGGKCIVIDTMVMLS